MRAKSRMLEACSTYNNKHCTAQQRAQQQRAPVLEEHDGGLEAGEHEEAVAEANEVRAGQRQREQDGAGGGGGVVVLDPPGPGGRGRGGRSWYQDGTVRWKRWDGAARMGASTNNHTLQRSVVPGKQRCRALASVRTVLHVDCQLDSAGHVHPLAMDRSTTSLSPLT